MKKKGLFWINQEFSIGEILLAFFCGKTKLPRFVSAEKVHPGKNIKRFVLDAPTQDLYRLMRMSQEDYESCVDYIDTHGEREVDRSDLEIFSDRVTAFENFFLDAVSGLRGYAMKMFRHRFELLENGQLLLIELDASDHSEGVQEDVCYQVKIVSSKIH